MESLIKNKKAEFNYEILEKYTGGIVLKGFEVKSLKRKHGSFEGSFLSIDKKGEIYLKSFYLPPFQEKNTPDWYSPRRDRKILLEKREIRELEDEIKNPGKTLIPLEFILDENNRIKLIFALVRGKKKYDKREDIKKRDIKREIDRVMKNFI